MPKNKNNKSKKGDNKSKTVKPKVKKEADDKGKGPEFLLDVRKIKHPSQV